MHDPELVIRTSGEQRLSNYLLWQTAYSEFVSRDELWPDFDRAAFEAALAEYATRQRRFGGGSRERRRGRRQAPAAAAERAALAPARAPQRRLGPRRAHPRRDPGARSR